MIPKLLLAVLGEPAEPGATSTGPSKAPSVSSATSTRVVIDDQRLVNFASCDYLGLARHPRVVEAVHTAVDAWGLGSGSGRVLAGTTVGHEALESEIAAWVGCETAVLYNSCWSANAGVFQVLADLARSAQSTLAIFSARQNHASIIDAIRAQRSATSSLTLFDHDTADGLRDLANGLGRRDRDSIAIVIVDGVFSMEGDLAPLTDIARLSAEYEALLIVDDSHGTGVAGPTGRGTAEAHGVLGDVDIVTGTLGKALGGSVGGFAATTGALAHIIRSLSRPYIFSNNPPPHVIAGVRAALAVLSEDREVHDLLAKRVHQMRTGLRRLGLSTTETEHPIVPVMIGDEIRATEMSHVLRRGGVYATALAYPIVPAGAARIRLQVTAAHSSDDIDLVLGAFESCTRSVRDSAPGATMTG